MENKSKLNEALTKAKDWLDNQVWWQQLKGQWQQLDPQQQTYAKYGGAGLGAFLVVMFILNTIFGVYDLKTQVDEKTELLNQLQAATQEIKILQSNRGSAMGGSQDSSRPDWNSYFQQMTNRANIPEGSFKISPPSTIGSEGAAQEYAINVDLTRINIRQAIQLAFYIETGPQPVKLKNLAITTDGPEGYLNAKLALSAFEVKDEGK